MSTAVESEADAGTLAGQPPVSFNRPRHKKDRGIGTMLILLLLVGGAAYGAATVFFDGEDGTETGMRPGKLLYTVQRGDILVTVTDDGNVESSKNIDVKCEVAGGSTILSIVPDGTTVEAGDEIIKLDTASIEDQLNSQKMNYEKALATEIQSREDYGAAQIAVQEYEEGTYLEELKTAEAGIRIAQENLRSAENVFEYTRKMVRKGFATSLQREADQFAVERAKLDLEAAETRRKVLTDFTRVRTLKDLEAKREAAAAKARADKAALDLELVRKERIQKQFDNCVIRAPQRGMVVYANDSGGSRFGGQQQVQVEEGAAVRERQAIVRLPDLSRMQVKMTVHESRVNQIRPGMPARIVIQDTEYKGHVISVANQPEATSFFTASVKEYATIVAIDGESTSLRPGMTAHVEILLADLRNVLTVPVSAVKELRGVACCWVATPSGPEKRELRLGQTNDSLIEVLEGLSEGDRVLRNPGTDLEEAKQDASLDSEQSRDRSRFGETASPGATGPGGASPRGGRPDGPPGGGAAGPAGGNGTPSGRPDVAGGGPPGSGSQSPGGGPPGAGSGGPPGGGPGGGGGGRSFNIMEHDANGDQKVSRDEAPESMQRFFDRLDEDGDGFVTKAESDAARQRFQQGGGRPGGGPPGGGQSGGPGGNPGGGTP